MTVKPRVIPEGSDEDPVENMLKKTGCIELHYKVQVNGVAQTLEGLLYGAECIATTKDWRKCQTEVNDFKDCINKHKKDEDSKLNR